MCWANSGFTTSRNTILWQITTAGSGSGSGSGRIGRKKERMVVGIAPVVVGTELRVLPEDDEDDDDETGDE